MSTKNKTKKTVAPLSAVCCSIQVEVSHCVWPTEGRSFACVGNTCVTERGSGDCSRGISSCRAFVCLDESSSLSGMSGIVSLRIFPCLPADARIHTHGMSSCLSCLPMHECPYVWASRVACVIYVSIWPACLYARVSYPPTRRAGVQADGDTTSTLQRDRAKSQIMENIKVLPW